MSTLQPYRNLNFYNGAQGLEELVARSTQAVTLQQSDFEQLALSDQIRIIASDPRTFQGFIDHLAGSLVEENLLKIEISKENLSKILEAKLTDTAIYLNNNKE